VETRPKPLLWLYGACLIKTRGQGLCSGLIVARCEFVKGWISSHLLLMSSLMPRPAESSNVTGSLLLDTHIALWLDSGDDHLRSSTRALIDGCWQNGGTIFLSAATAWEIALLVDIGRIDLDLPIEAWVERFLERRGIEAVPLGNVPASRAYQFHRLEHRDPADRLLIVTAIELACPLVTYDARIVRFSRKYGRQCRFAVAA